MRKVSTARKTHETDINVTINLDGTGESEINTGIGFLDHMLDQLSRHGLIDITLSAKGDLEIDAHHTAEDCGLALGEAMRKALGERRGIRRYGSALSPMDEALARVAVDCSNRPFLVWKVRFDAPRIGEFESELVREWFHAFAQSAGLTLHVETLYGDNNHHIAEACFKGLARALRDAVEQDPRRGDAVPSTKGTLAGSL